MTANMPEITMEKWFDPEAIIEEFESLTMDAGRVQRETLKKILEENGETEYLLSKCGLNGRSDPESFKACVPIVTHTDLQPYIQRIADGEGQHTPILTGKPITAISLRFDLVILNIILFICTKSKKFIEVDGGVVLVRLKGSPNT